MAVALAQDERSPDKRDGEGLYKEIGRAQGDDDALLRVIRDRDPMSTGERRAREIIEAAAEQQRRAVERAIEMGGLPTEAEADEVWTLLSAAFDKIERIEIRLRGICESDDGSDLPFTIGMGEIGTVAVIADTIENRMDDFRRMHSTISAKRWELDTLRHEQRARRS